MVLVQDAFIDVDSELEFLLYIEGVCHGCEVVVFYAKRCLLKFHWTKVLAV